VLARLPGLRLLQLAAEIALIPADFRGAQSPVQTTLCPLLCR
jgi:hypothetical protein